jgi:hypothetical protein
LRRQSPIVSLTGYRSYHPIFQIVSFILRWDALSPSVETERTVRDGQASSRQKN